MRHRADLTSQFYADHRFCGAPLEATRHHFPATDTLEGIGMRHPNEGSASLFNFKWLAVTSMKVQCAVFCG